MGHFEINPNLVMYLMFEIVRFSVLNMITSFQVIIKVTVFDADDPGLRGLIILFSPCYNQVLDHLKNNTLLAGWEPLIPCENPRELTKMFTHYKY